MFAFSLFFQVTCIYYAPIIGSRGGHLQFIVKNKNLDVLS